MIIALEGAPAVGKTTIANYLSKQHGCHRVAEVNELYLDRPVPEPDQWYCERQIDRMKIASESGNSVLDGDPFQAVWFSWIYPDRGFVSWQKSMDFFVENEEYVILPSLYAYLFIDEEARYVRERKREEERGHSHRQFLNKWNRYAEFAAPQRAFFEAIGAEYPGWVLPVETVDLKQSIGKLVSATPVTPPEQGDFMSWLSGWLTDNSPGEIHGAA